MVAVRVHVVDGLPVASQIDTWIALSSLLSRDELIAVGDAIVDPRRTSFTRDDLTAAVKRHGARHGAVRLREALEEIREGARSAQETALRLALTRAGQPMPILNPDVVDRSGVFMGQVDLIYGRARIAIEYEGDHHRVEPDTWRKDIARRERFEDAGWRTMRVTGSDARESFRTVIARVDRLLRERVR